MGIPVLIEPTPGNGYRAKAGEPLALTAEAATRDAALQKLRELIEEWVAAGAEIISIDLPERIVCGVVYPVECVVVTQDFVTESPNGNVKMSHDQRSPSGSTPKNPKPTKPAPTGIIAQTGGRPISTVERSGRDNDRVIERYQRDLEKKG